MAALKRRAVLFLAPELREASTTTGLYQNQTGQMLPINPEIEFDPARYARAINRSSFTTLGSLNGVRAGRARFGLEVTGIQFADALRCCSFADEVLQRFTIPTAPGSITVATFRHGERVDQASSGAYGILVSDTYDTQGVLWVAQAFQFGSGTFDGTGEIVGASSGARVTPTAFAADSGRGWWPYSYRISRLLFDGTGLTSSVAQGDLLRGITSGAVASVFYAQSAGAGAQVMVERQHSHFATGETVENISTGDSNIGDLDVVGYEVAVRSLTAAIGIIKDYVREEIEWSRGNVKLSGTIGEPAIFNFEFLGRERNIIDRGQNVHPNLGTIPVPPVLLGASFYVGAEDAAPDEMVSRCIRSFEIDMQHEVALQECMALSADHGPFFTSTPRGIDMALVASRRPIMKIDPYLDPEIVFPWMDIWMNNSSLRLRLEWGGTGGKKFTLSVPSASISGAGTGDINAVSTRNITLELCGGNASGPRSDNELVLVEDLTL